jgi:hypothetical protein
MCGAANDGIRHPDRRPGLRVVHDEQMFVRHGINSAGVCVIFR